MSEVIVAVGGVDLNECIEVRLDEGTWLVEEHVASLREIAAR
jgi:hypothetical protein